MSHSVYHDEINNNYNDDENQNNVNDGSDSNNNLHGSNEDKDENENENEDNDILEIDYEREDNLIVPTDYDYEALDEQLAKVECSKIEISTLEHQYSIILKTLKEVETKKNIMKKQNEILIKEQKTLRDQVELLNKSEENTKRKCEEEVNELEQQIRDLCFYTKMKNQVASSPLREELKAGSVVMPASVYTANSSSGVQQGIVGVGSKKKNILMPNKKSK